MGTYLGQYLFLNSLWMLQDYDQDTSLLCRVVRISRHDLALLGTETGCIAIRWMVSPELAEEIQHMTVTDELLMELAQRNIVKISIGSDFHLSIATMNYWQAAQVATTVASTLHLLDM